jgi:starch synthase (maltosyl-transferring)
MKTWEQIPMTAAANDRFHAGYIPGQPGIYEFRIKAWVDHLATWHRDIQKKIAAGQDIKVEAAIGAQLLEQHLDMADKKKKAIITSWISILRNTKEIPAILSLIAGGDWHQVLRGLHHKDTATISGQDLRFDAERERALFSTWYELFPRSASAEPGRHGSFRDVQLLLPRIAAMGFDVLYLPPVHPIGRSKRKGKNNALEAGEQDPGSPWAIGSSEGGHKAIHPELGSLREFRQLITAAKKQNIELAMDLAFQCSPDHPWVKEHPAWFRWRPDGTVQFAENPPKKYEDILPLNFESADWQGLWQELKSVTEYWIGQGVRIFRVDNPHTKPFPFWEWMIREVRKQYPEVIFLAEAFTRPALMARLAKAGFTQSYTYFTWRNTKQELETYIKELTTTEMRHYFRPNFWPNTPDILPPFLSQGGENASIIRLVLAATLSASYGIYGPVYEHGIVTPYPNKEEYAGNEKYERKHWDWNADTRLREIITIVNRARKMHAALQDTFNITIHESGNEHIICYSKTDKPSGDRIIVVVNLDPFHTQSGYVHIPTEPSGKAQPFEVYDLLSGARYQWQCNWNYVSLNPYEMPAHLFSTQPVKS